MAAKAKLGKWLVVTGLAFILSVGYLTVFVEHFEKKVTEEYTYTFTKNYTLKSLFDGTAIKRYDIFLSKTIDEVEKYTDILTILQTADKHTKIYIYLAGDGGFSETLYRLFYTMKSSEGTITTVLSGNAYSSHAFLLFAGDFIKIENRDAIVMLHTGSVIDRDELMTCKDNKDFLDRGQSKYAKCVKYFKTLKIQNKAFDETIKIFLTEKEYKMVVNGHDVYLFGHQIERRLKGEPGITHPVNNITLESILKTIKNEL